MTTPSFRSVDQHTGAIARDGIDKKFVAAQHASATALRLWEDLANELMGDVQSLECGTDRLQETAVRLQELEAENADLTTRLAVAQEARNTAGAWGQMGERK